MITVPSVCNGSIAGEHVWSSDSRVVTNVETIQVKFKSCMHCGLQLFAVYTERTETWSDWMAAP